MKLAMMLLWAFKQARAHVPYEEESGRRFSHSFLYKTLNFQVFANMGESVLLMGTCCVIS